MDSVLSVSRVEVADKETANKKGVGMKKILLFSIVFMLCIGLTGCVYHKILVVNVKGDKVDAPIGSYTPIQGKNVTGTVTYQSFITDEKGREIPTLSDIAIKNEKDNVNSVDVAKEAK